MLTLFSCWAEGPAGGRSAGRGPGLQDQEAGGPRAGEASKGRLRWGALRRGPCGEQGSARRGAGRPLPDLREKGRRGPGDLERSRGAQGPGAGLQGTEQRGEQGEGEALRRGGALGVEGPRRRGSARPVWIQQALSCPRRPGGWRLQQRWGRLGPLFPQERKLRKKAPAAPHFPPPSYSSPRLSPPVRQGRMCSSPAP